MELSKEILERLRHLYRGLTPLRLYGGSHHVLTEKLSILTVSAGLRPIALVNAWPDIPDPAVWTTLKAVVRSSGLLVRVTQPCEESLSHVSIPDEFKKVASTTRGKDDSDWIWIYGSWEAEKEIGALFRKETSIGIILRYPSCCVTEDDKFSMGVQKTFYEALVTRYKPKSPEQFRKLLSTDAPVKIEVGPEKRFQQMRDSRGVYPFVFHTACKTCLEAESSPTSHLNRQYHALAENIEPGFARAIETEAVEAP